MFLKTALFDHLLTDQPSLQDHSLSLLQEHGCSISKQGIDKRFNARGVAFLERIFKNYFSRHIDVNSIRSEWERKFTTIRVMDSTEFKLSDHHSENFPGYTGSGTNACAQLQFEYDLFSGRIENLSLENALTSDVTYSLSHMETLSAGSLVLRDLGYYNVNAYKKLEEQKIYYISRLKPQINMYEVKNNRYVQLSYATLIKRLRKSGRPYLDLEIFIGRETLYPVRLVANLLDDEAIVKRTKRVEKRRRGTHNIHDRYLNQLNLFVTNVCKGKLKSNELYRLYKLRWQVELVFKGWKSVFKIHLLRKMNTERLKCYLLSKMIWILFTWDIYNAVNKRLWNTTKEKILSVFKCFSLIKHQAGMLKQVFMKSKTYLYQWILSMNDILLRYGLKEHRKGRVNVVELLKLEGRKR